MIRDTFGRRADAHEAAEGEPEALGSDEVELLTAEDDHNERLDRFVAGALDGLSRVFVQQLIDNGRVQVNGLPRRRSFKLRRGDFVVVDVPATVPDDLAPEPIPLDIVFENGDVIVLNKPAGMVVHPAPGHPSGTLVNALLAHAPEMAVSGTRRPGIVHRLDKDTSGLMVVAKTDRAKLALISQWQDRLVEKGYAALVRGVVEPEEATIDAPIGRDPANRKRMATVASGRPAVTHLRVRRRFAEATLLDVGLETGRTHQVRVHLAFIGHPIVCDSLYNRHGGRTGGSASIAPRQFLHSARLGFHLPEGRRVTFEMDLPPDLKLVLEELNRTADRR